MFAAHSGPSAVCGGFPSRRVALLVTSRSMEVVVGGQSTQNESHGCVAQIGDLPGKYINRNPLVEGRPIKIHTHIWRKQRIARYCMGQRTPLNCFIVF